MSWKIPYFQLDLGEEEKSAVVEVLQSNWLTSGPRVTEFERRFAEALEPGVHAVAVSNCTAALHLAMLSLGIGPGDEVIVPSLTFAATANAVRYVGATPVFADICSADEWNLDPGDVESKITARTRAVTVMHYGGYPCRMDDFLELARRRALKIVEDVAHGPLAQCGDRKQGTIGDIGCFSFFSNKNMTTGEGGMVVTRDQSIAEAVRTLRSHGMTSNTYQRFTSHAFGYDVQALGYNYRLDEIRAAIGLQQLRKLPQNNAERRRIVERYREVIGNRAPAVRMPFAGWDGNYGYHIFPVLLPDTADRARIMARMAEQGIQTSIHYQPVHTFTAYADCGARLAKTEAIAPRILSLPLYPTLRADQMEAVASSLGACLA